MNKHSCWENSATQEHLTLNHKDGTAFIMVSELTGNGNSRIGNPNFAGVHYQRGINRNDWRQTPVGLPTGSVYGGSTILICADSMSSISVKMFSKYCSGSSTNDLGRCYIATETPLQLDEALYAWDRVSNPSRLSDTFNIRGFGDGSDNVGTAVTKRFNTYAKITAIDSTRTVLTISNKTNVGVADIKVGALVMIHAMHKDDTNVKHSGRFHIANVVGITQNGTKLTIDKAIPKLSGYTTDNYDFQVIAIPQYSTLNMKNATHDSTPVYTGGHGGILAVACSGTLNLEGAKLDVMAKGGGAAYGKNGLKYISNAGLADRLPIGQGHGSIFILANEIKMDTSTRLGATYDGDKYGGTISNLGTGHGYLGGAATGSYSGFTNDEVAPFGTGRYEIDEQNASIAGGFGAGISPYKHDGGYGSNAAETHNQKAGLQGAHILIVANKITGFNQKAISTGGMGNTKSPNWTSGHGGASYGGGGLGVQTVDDKGRNAVAYGSGGGFVGGGGGGGDEGTFAAGGGSGGFCFVYCNTVDSQVTTDTVLD